MSQLLTHHALRRTAALALAVAGVCALGACAGDDPVTSPAQPGAGDSTTDPDTPVTSGPGDTAAPPPTSTAPAGEPVAADLTVTVDNGVGTTSDFALTCEPVGGRHPDAAAACAALAAVGAQAFDPLPKDIRCTDIYGGPQTATVKGTLDGEPVSAQFARTNGCEIGRWDAVSAIFGPTGGTDA